MNTIPTDREVLEYSRERLLVAIQVHERNIGEFAKLTVAERERIGWIRAILARKSELEANGAIHIRPRGQTHNG